MLTALDSGAQPTTPPGFVRRQIREPAFAYSSIEAAEAITRALIESARKSRAVWNHLRETAAAELQAGLELAKENKSSCHLPAVQTFMRAWALNLEWPVMSLSSFGMQLNVPNAIVESLRRCSNVADLEFRIMDRSDFSFATMCSHDHHLTYGLMINAPMWIGSAVNPDWEEQFGRFLRSVVHHEMAHFRWIHSGLRGEFLGHARAVGALLVDRLQDGETDVSAALANDPTGMDKNLEVRQLLDETRGGARLIRYWAWRIRQVAQLGAG